MTPTRPTLPPPCAAPHPRAVAARPARGAALAAALGPALAAAIAAAPFVATRPACAAEGPRAHEVEAAIPGTPWTAVVAEGEGEPRSIGSYTLRVYSPAREGGARDRFVGGAIRPRDGTVESSRIADRAREGTPERGVVLRSVGTGSYQSADAYRLRGGVPRFAASVEGLPADDEPMRALSAKLRPRGR
jgi:hypothetical protein